MAFGTDGYFYLGDCYSVRLNSYTSEKTERAYTRRTVEFLQPLTDRTAYMVWERKKGVVGVAFFRFEDCFVIRFTDIADFTYMHGDVVCDRLAWTDDATCEHLYQNQVLPLLRSLSGKLALHASAISTESGAILFVARSGRGKSTLAATFGSVGYPVITDDSAIIEPSGPEGPLMIEPGHRSVRLWHDSAGELSGKDYSIQHQTKHARSVKSDLGDQLSYCDESQPIVAVFHVLPPGPGAVNVIGISPMAAFRNIALNQFVLDDRDKTLLSKQFHVMTRLAEAVPHFELAFPHQYGLLPEIRKAVLSACLKKGE